MWITAERKYIREKVIYMRVCVRGRSTAGAKDTPSCRQCRRIGQDKHLLKALFICASASKSMFVHRRQNQCCILHIHKNVIAYHYHISHLSKSKGTLLHVIGRKNTASTFRRAHSRSAAVVFWTRRCGGLGCVWRSRLV